jgi:SAM-dependent methyltransferase
MGWFYDYLDVSELAEDESVTLNGYQYRMHDGILRQESLYSQSQSQTAEVYGYLFSSEDVFTHEASVERQQKVLQTNFPNWHLALSRVKQVGRIKVLDVGVGDGISSYLLLKDSWQNIDYCGVEIAKGAADFALKFLREKHVGDIDIVQANMTELPFTEPLFDLVSALGAFHRTDDIFKSLSSVAKLLKPGGTIMFSIQKRQPPVTGLVNNFIRESIAPLNFAEQLDVMAILTKFGQIVGEALGDIEVNLADEVPVFEIPAGHYRLQALLYDYLLHLYYSRSLTDRRCLAQNIDWFLPRYLHQTTPETAREYCLEAGFLEPEIHLSARSNLMGVIATKRS